jgi:hypothetical protein
MRPTPLLAVTVGLVMGIALPVFVPSLRTPSRAGTALHMDLEEVVRRSALVVEGRVLRGTCGETPNGTIYTDWEIAVERTFLGADHPTRIVRLPGGMLPSGRGMVIPGMPRVTAGEDVVLLLGEESEGGLRMPTGLSQGKYRISVAADGERTAVQSGDHVTLVNEDRSRSVDGVRILDYAELVARLEAASQARAVAPGSADSEAESDD